MKQMIREKDFSYDQEKSDFSEMNKKKLMCPQQLPFGSCCPKSCFTGFGIAVKRAFSEFYSGHIP